MTRIGKTNMLHLAVRKSFSRCAHGCSDPSSPRLSGGLPALLAPTPRRFASGDSAHASLVACVGEGTNAVAPPASTGERETGSEACLRCAPTRARKSARRSPIAPSKREAYIEGVPTELWRPCRAATTRKLRAQKRMTAMRAACATAALRARWRRRGMMGSAPPTLESSSTGQATTGVWARTHDRSTITASSVASCLSLERISCPNSDLWLSSMRRWSSSSRWYACAMRATLSRCSCTRRSRSRIDPLCSATCPLTA
mmetsp:Transcript_524/g.1341  ORF Transcript_524/g.1341 Transcript_524/m.1341 type:complete len:257 (-) Transcript_524:341-1111(-)